MLVFQRDARAWLDAARCRLRRLPARRAALAALTALVALPAADAGAATVLTTQAESFTPDSGVLTWDVDDGVRTSLVIASTGGAGRSVSLPSDADRVVVRARGELCSGAPTAELRVDGVLLRTVSLSSTAMADFAVDKAFKAGTHTVKVSFTNDYHSSSCDRNVWADYVQFQKVGTTTTDPPPSTGDTTTPPPSTGDTTAPPPSTGDTTPPPSSGTESSPLPGLTAASTCTFGSFAVNAWPGSCWRPYASTSPFNKPIPATPRLVSNSAQIVSRVVGFGAPGNLVAGTADTSDDWNHPTYYSKSTDPLYTLHCTEAWGRCAIEGMKVRVPSAARAAGGGDGHMTIVDQAGGYEYDLWTVTSKPSGGGTLSAHWGGRTPIGGSGLGSAAVAANWGNLAGVIRAQEMAAGRINHALFMVINCGSGGKVYPSTGTGRACSSIGQSNTNAPPMGSRFQLNMSASQIDALAVPAWKKTILKAMATYGMYFGDTGGGTWGLQFESGSTYTSFGVQDQMVAFAKANGVPAYNGRHVFSLKDGVDWGRYLRVIDPCTTQGTC